MNQDELWMARAIALAEKGNRRTSPNPLVGAVVVRRGSLVSQGYHSFFGGPHAEVVALEKAGHRAKDATLYVTLEPCSSWGKTPPCVDAVIKSGVKRVVVGSLDPNPENHRVGIQKLKRAGIKIQAGTLADRVKKQNEAFFKTQREGIPFITLKMAQSLDGKIASQTGESRWISSEASRRFVHGLRDQVDAVLVGKRTAHLDNPRLFGTGGGEKPWRVVLDSDFSLSQEARIFQGPQLTFVAISEKELPRLYKNSNPGRKILIPVAERKGRLDLYSLLKELARLGVNHLLVEGGGEVAWSLVSRGWVDRLIWIVSPKIIGGRQTKTSVEGEGFSSLKQSLPLRWEKVYRLGEDWVFEARPCLREA